MYAGEDLLGIEMEIDAKSSSDYVGSRYKIWRLVLATGSILVATFIQLPHALSLDQERNATVNSGERVRIWVGANYGRRSASDGYHVVNFKSLRAMWEEHVATTVDADV